VKKLSKPKTWYWVCFPQVHIRLLFYSILEHLIHSFISSSFVIKHNLPMATMNHTMLVSSLRGEMRTRHIWPTVSITIRGVDFPSNLILLDSKGIDVIHGMDWLSKY
jgi:hypothetical protein